MKTNLHIQYQLNQNKPVFALQASYKAFKTKMDVETDYDFSTMIVNAPYNIIGDIAIIDFIGFTVNTASELEEQLFGVVSLQNFYSKLQIAAMDESVNTIVVNVDSGGGYVQYLPEVNELIQSIKETKEIIAFTTGYMCSAAYEMACNCSYVFASPSSFVGSIGGYLEIITYNGASQLSPDGVTISNLSDLGITVTTIQDGTDKTVGSEFIALSKEQIQNELVSVKASVQEFRNTVTTNRGNVDNKFMQGDYYTGTEAMKLNTNLIDGTVSSLSELILAIY